MSQVTGRVRIVIDGVRYRSKEGASLDTGGIAREAAMSDSGVDGYSEKYTTPKVDFSINHTADISLEALQAITNSTLLFQTDTGRVYTLRGAWCAEPPKLSKNEVSLSFQATECIEG